MRTKMRKNPGISLVRLSEAADLSSWNRDWSVDCDRGCGATGGNEIFPDPVISYCLVQLRQSSD